MSKMMSAPIRALAFSSLLSLAVAGGVAPAAARSGEASAGSAGRSDSQSGTAAQSQARKVRYCVVTQVTGSLIPRKVCKSKEDWAAEGFDVDAHDK